MSRSLEIRELDVNEIAAISGGSCCDKKEGIDKTWCELKERAAEVWDWFFG